MKYLLSTLSIFFFIFLFTQSAHSYNTKGVIVYPVPYYPGIGIFQATDLSGIGFHKVKMKIYTIDGEEVFSGTYPGYPAIWTGRNKEGERVDPGMYIVNLKSENVLNGLHGVKNIKILVNGGSKGTFTRGGWVGGKYIAMGKNGEVTADDVYSIYWNPAGLNELRHTQILTETEIKEKAEKGKLDDITENELIRFSEEEKSFYVQMGFSGSMLSFGTKTAFVGAAINLPVGVLGLGSYTIYSGDIDRRDYNGYKTGRLDYLASAEYLSYGVSLGVASFGFSFKGLYEKIGNTNYMGFGADVGTQVYILPFLKVGLMLQDLGIGMMPLEARMNIPQKYNLGYPTLKIGLALITNRNFTLAVSGIKKLDQKTFGYSIGARYDVVKWASLYVGLNNLVFSAGLTFHIVQFDVSYAFTMDIITKSFNHHVSATVLF